MIKDDYSDDKNKGKVFFLLQQKKTGEALNFPPDSVRLEPVRKVSVDVRADSPASQPVARLP